MDLFTDSVDYDRLGRVTSLERAIASVAGDVAALWSGSDGPDNKAIGYDYNVDGTRRRTDRKLGGAGSPTIAATLSTHTPGGRVETINHHRGSTDSPPQFSQHSYAYDAAGRLAGQGDHYRDGEGNFLRVSSRAFTHDGAGQLTSVTETIDAGITQVRDFTDGQSSTSTVFTVGADNRLSQDDNYDYEYNPEGQLKSRTARDPNAAIAKETFRFDPAGRLITVTQLDADDATAATIRTIDYGYDASGLQIGRRVTGSDGTVSSHTGHLRQGLQILADLDLSASTPKLETVYLHGTQANEIVATDVLAGSDYQTVWSFTDALGSVTTQASHTGTDWYVVHNVTAEYGSARSQLGDTTVDHLANAAIWAGHHIDPLTGLTEAKARWYDSATGRFISPSIYPGVQATANPIEYLSVLNVQTFCRSIESWCSDTVGQQDRRTFIYKPEPSQEPQSCELGFTRKGSL